MLSRSPLLVWLCVRTHTRAAGRVLALAKCLGCAVEVPSNSTHQGCSLLCSSSLTSQHQVVAAPCWWVCPSPQCQAGLEQRSITCAALIGLFSARQGGMAWFGILCLLRAVGMFAFVVAGRQDRKECGCARCWDLPPNCQAESAARITWTFCMMQITGCHFPRMWMPALQEGGVLNVLSCVLPLCSYKTP